MKKLSLILIFLFTSIPASYGTEVKVLFVKGIAKRIYDDGKEMALSKGLFLAEEDTIKTKRNSFVVLKINGHSLHRIEESSEIVLAKLPYFFENSKEIESGGSFYLKVGTIVSDILKKSDTETFQLKTKNTVMGIRGTKLMASLINDSLILSVDSGEVEIENKLSGQNDYVSQRESIVVEKDLNFTGKKRYQFHKDITWNVQDYKKTKSFLSLRNKSQKEIKSRRSRWVRDHAKINKRKDNWKKRKLAWKKRTRKLTKSKIRIKNQKRSVRRQEYRELKKPLSERLKNKAYKGLVRPGTNNDHIRRKKLHRKYRRPIKKTISPPSIRPSKLPKPPVNTGGTSGDD